MTRLMSPLCATKDESDVFQWSVEISIVIYPCLKRDLHADYLDKYIWREYVVGNHFVAILMEIACQY